jgi:tetrahydromethanopterin S-methyltransferase subunit G
MADEINVLDYLREQFARVHARFDDVDRRLDELTLRVGRLVLMARNQDEAMKEMRSQSGEMLGAMSAINNRLERIERRLDLVEG